MQNLKWDTRLAYGWLQQGFIVGKPEYGPIIRDNFPQYLSPPSLISYLSCFCLLGMISKMLLVPVAMCVKVEPTYDVFTYQNLLILF